MKLHLPKKLLAAVMALFAVGVNTTMGSDTISINFGSGNYAVTAEATGELWGAGGDDWNNFTIKTIANSNLTGAGDDDNRKTYDQAFTIEKTDTGAYSPIRDSWSESNKNSVAGKMQYRYIDLNPNGPEGHWKVKLDLDTAVNEADAAHTRVDLRLYFSSDGGKNQISSVNVGGTSYIGGGIANNSVTSAQGWGEKGNAASETVGSHNTIWLANWEIADLNELTITNDWIDATKRGTISGIQVKLIDVYDANLTAGTNVAENITWSGVGSFNGAYTAIETVAERYLRADVSAGNATLEFANGAKLATLHAKGGNTLTVTTDGSLTIGDFYTESGSTISLGANILKNNDTLTIGGEGTVELTESVNLTNVLGYGKLHIAKGVKINLTAFDFAGVATGDEGAELNIDLSKNSSTTINGITVTNNGGTVSGNALSEGKAEFSCSNDASIGVSSTGGTLLVTGEEGTKVTLNSLVLNGSSTTTLSADEGVTLSGTAQRFQIDTAGQELVVGTGVSLIHTGVGDVNLNPTPAENYALAIGNGKLTIDGGRIDTVSLIAGDFNYDKKSTINIDNNGLLNIYGEVNSINNGWAYYGKNGSARLNHWSGSNVEFNISNGGEFRVLGATVNVGDNGTKTVINTKNGGILNVKGFVRATNDTIFQLNAYTGSYVNIGEEGIQITNDKEVSVSVSGTIGALSEKGWSSTKAITLNDGAKVQLAVWDVENNQYTDTAADIDLTAGVNGNGTLTLAGSGKLIVKQALAHDVSSTGGQLALTGLSNCEFVGTVDSFTGYGDSTTDGYAAAMYRIAGASSTITEAILIKGEGNELTCAVDAGVMTVDGGTVFVVNTEVDRAKITEWKEGSSLVLGANSVYRTSEISDLGVIDKVVDDTAVVYVQNTEGKDLLKITNVPTAALNITIGGEGNNEILCSDSTYTGNFTVLSGATLKQSGGDAVDTAGAPLYNDAGKNRTITVQNQATFDINGTDACYHVILEGGATLKNSSSDLGMDIRNTPIIELKGNATVQADNRFGMLGSEYDSTTLTLNNNTLTKTGLGTFHLNNCTVDAGTIEILSGTVAITEKNGQNSSNGTSNISAATFKVGKSTIGTGDEAQHVQGMLSYNENAKGTLEIGHVIAAGGVVLAGENKEIVLSKLSGVSSATDSYITKIGRGTLRLADDIKISDDITVYANIGTLAIGAVDIATDKTLNITGTATADVLTKKGAGSLTLDALTANVVNMSTGLSIESITGGAQIIYTDVASIGSITALGGDTIIDLFGVADSVADGINLGIAYSDENVAKVKLVALEDMVDADGNATWELVNDKGFIKLQGKDGAKITVHTDWDPNWGGTVLHGSPKEVKSVSLTTSTSLMDNNEYKVGDQIAVQLTGSGNASAIITGGACHTTQKKEGDPVALNNDVWIDAAKGTYKAIVGGHWTNCWANTTPYSVDSDVHIVLKGATVEHIIGGSVRETVNPIHEGDSYISIFNGDVTGNIVGASTVGYHGDGADTKAEFNGTTNIFVYTLLNNNTATNIFSESEETLTDVIGAIVGGGMVHGHNQKANLSVNKIANVTIDLSNVTTSTTSIFSKMIVGGNLNCNNDDVDDGTNTYIYGTNVTIKGNGVTFTNKVIGASYVNMGNNTVGDVSLDISGGTYSNIVTGGVYAYSKANCTISDVVMNLSGAECSEWVAGGAFLNSSNTILNMNTVKMTMKDATFDKLVAGGVFVGGHSSTITGGDIEITIDGAEFTEFYGSAYHYNTQYGSTSRVGDVRIALVGDGVVSGAIYAAGGAAGSAANIYVNSTTISIEDTVQLKDGSIISAGFNVPEGDYRNVSVTGDRTILFTGEKSQDRTGILFSDFNKIGVETAGKTATIDGADITITDALTVIGNGTIKLAEKTGLIATQGITIEKTATVAVNGNAVTGDVVANGGVNVVGGGSLNGMLTLAEGSTLTLWNGTENGTNGVLDMSVPAEDGASLLAEGNVLTIGGLFGLDVKVNPDGEVELVTGLGGIEGITFDEENKALAGTYLSDINGEDVDGKLYLVYEEGTLKLSAIAGMTDFYWEDTDATGETWTEKLWSVKDNNSDNLVFIKDAATRTDDVNAFFNNGKAENVLVDTTATVDDLTVSGAGSDYTFSQATGTNGTLTIEGKLTVTDSATATFDGALADVGAAEMEVSKGATLVAGAVTVTDAVTVDAGTLNVTSLGAASLDASNGASIDADNVVITGKVGVDSAGLDISDSLSAAEITITGDTASVEADTITVGEGGLNMAGGTLAVDTLTGEGTAEITGGTLTIGSTDLSSVDVSGAEFVGSSTLAGSDAVDVTVGGVSVGDGAELNLSDATLTDKMTAGTDATLIIDGAMHLDVTNSDFDLENKSTYAETTATDDLGKEIADGGNGFVSRNEVYTVVTGDLTNVDATGADWTVGADARVGEYDGGKVTISESKDTTTYWVNTGAVEVIKAAANFADDTATIKLNGGTLKIDEDTDKAIVTNNENAYKTDSLIALLNGSTLEMEKLTITDGTTVTLSGSADSALELGDGYKVDSTKLKGLDNTDAWLGTVKTGAINGGLTPVDISGLGNANSSVEADSISGQSMTAGTVGTVDVLGDVSLTNGDSTVNDMTVEGKLSLGATAKSSLDATDLTVKGSDGIDLQNGSTVDADTLIVTNGGIDLSEGSAVIADEALTVGAGITLGKDAQVKAGELKVGSLSLEEGSSVGADTLTVEGSIEYKSLAADAPITVGDMTNDTLDLTVDTELLKDAVDAGQDVTFIHVANGSEAEISLNGGSNVLKNHGEKYSYTVDWDEAGQNVTLDAIANENYMKEKFEGAEPNAIAGATLMDEAFASDGIGAGGDLEKLLAAVDNGSMTEEGMAAVAGSSTASLGMAFAGDVERQLRAIRNRTTTMGVNQCVVNEGMPYFNAWVNAEGNFGELDQDGLASGYQLDSWGGTVGFDVDVNPNLTLGLAVTAMYGDLTVDGPDMLEGDLDTYYVTAFARYSKRAWTHTFIGTIGMMDGSYERTVNYAGGSYKTEGDMDGMAFGLMYEVGRVYALTEDGDACLQPVFNIAYRHTTVGGYTEDGSDAALDVDDQTLDTITLGAGARFQAVVGENLYNRTSVLELRALAKLDVGDRASEADVAFIGGGSRATVESAELGAFGVELGAGLSIPVGDENDGTIFFDVSAELRSGYNNVNGTVGYRINF